LENSPKENLVNDIENRLDNFFDDNDEANVSEEQTVSLEKLKSVVLSIDWEITEDCLNDLIDETDALLPHFEKDRYPHTLLRMLKAVGGYIRKRKAQAHPGSIKKIMSVFSSIEQLADSTDMDEESKKQIVAKEIAGFLTLKEQVEKQRGAGVKPGDATAQSSQKLIEADVLDNAINAIEDRFNSQVEDLKSQLATLQEELDHLRKKP
jgi:hypothetical protein